MHPTDVIIEGVTYTINKMKTSITVSNTMATTYHISTSQHSGKTGALVNHGANGGIACADCHVIEAMDCFVNVESIDSHMIGKCPIVMAGGVTKSNRGHVILIMNQ